VKALLKSLFGPAYRALRERRRAAELKAKLAPVTAASLASDLARLPLPDAPVVLVHSSMKALGFVEGGPETVIAALVKVIVEDRGGTLLLPTFTIDGSMARTLESGRVFDVRATPSNLGSLPEAFRRRPEAVRSVHPTHSFAAVGPRAAWLTDGHHLAETSFGTGTPMAKLREADGFLLGLGTNLGSVTFYHCLEDDELIPAPFNIPDRLFPVECIDADGAVHRRTYPAHNAAIGEHRIDRPHRADLRELYARWFERRAGLGWHRVGAASCWLVRARGMYDASRELAEGGASVYSHPPAAQAFAAAHGIVLERSAG